jgi:hypothetical protein
MTQSQPDPNNFSEYQKRAFDAFLETSEEDETIYRDK